jgi:hypothetical protein
MTFLRNARFTTHSTFGTLIFSFMLLMLLPTMVHAGSGQSTAAFSAGTARIAIAFGGAVAFDQNYSVFGIGGGYFIADGVEVGLDAEEWSGNSPRVEQVSPQVRVVLSTEASVKPYLGAFYRRTFIQGYGDHDTIGARAGLYFLTGRRAYFGAGLAEEVHLNCDRTVYSSCSETYPELLFAVIF